MRIAIVSPSRNAYSETFIRAHIERLEGEKLVLIDGHLPARTGDDRPLLSGGLTQRALRKLNGTSPEEALRRAVAKALVAHRTQVLLAEFGPTGEALLGTARSLRIPMVVHFHGVDAFHADLLAKHGHYARLRDAGVHLVAVSREMEHQLLHLGAARDRVHYNCYGIDVEQFVPGDPASAPPRFVAVGRFVEKKAPQLTLLAFERALREVPAAELVMLGDGPLLGPVRAMARALGIGDRVHFEGVAGPGRVAEVMRNARAFVQHSIVSDANDHEGTPLAVLEAMACALPVIATRHGGIPDVAIHGTTALLCAEHDVAAMAHHMAQLARDPEQAATLGKAARQRALQHHRVQDSIAALQGILAQAVADGPPRS